MWQGYGRKSNCPGIPKSSYGFNSADKRIKCYGEVFKILAVEKSDGERIKGGDKVALYYIHEGKMVSFYQSNTQTSECLLGKHGLNDCSSEIVELHIFDD